MSTNSSCAVCRLPIDAGGAVVALQKYYHRQCFLCHQCLMPFPDGSFIPDEDGLLYCEPDYYQLYGERCAHCGDVITDQIISALDKKWHAQHFTCAQCGKGLASSAYVTRNQQAFCKECDQADKGTRTVEYTTDLNVSI